MGRIRTIKPELLPMQQEPAVEQHYLYVLQEGYSRNFKIGHAGHPRRRLSSLQGGNPQKLRIVACYAASEPDCRWLELEALVVLGAGPGSEWVKTTLAVIIARIAILCEALG